MGTYKDHPSNMLPLSLEQKDDDLESIYCSNQNKRNDGDVGQVVRSGQVNKISNVNQGRRLNKCGNQVHKNNKS